jgi:predicted Zn finger-like uncharacterized protein
VKISCQSCQAKYTIADEKVLGKIVKIRCKKCGATIVINGNEPDASTQAHDQVQPGAAAGGVFDYSAQQGGEPWTVNVSDGDQRSMTSAELVGAFHAGTVNDETYCWRDGMADWLPVREIPELQQAVAAGPPQGANADVGGYDPHQHPPATDDQATQAGFSSLFGGGGQQQPQNGGAALFGGGGQAAPAAAAATTAARRAGGRGGGGADLFGGIAQAGGEQDVMTSASANQQAPIDDKPTGSRNENSVLFSLAALTSSAPEKKDASPMGGGGEGSGLIDIRALSATMEQKKDGNRKVDDIMNLSGGGAFSAALAAPVLAPAPADMADFGPTGEPRKSNATLMIGVLAGFVIVGVLVAGGVFLAMSKNTTSSVATNATTTAATATTAATDPAATGGGGGTTAQAGGADPGGTTTAARPGVGQTGAGNVRPPTGGGGTNAVGGGANTGVGGGTTAVVPPVTGGGGGSKCAPGDLQCAMAAGAGTSGSTNTAATAAGGSQPFNSGNAAAVLGPIAGSLGSCKRSDGPTGNGHAKITFQPSGTVSTVELDSGPFTGTAVGGCVAGKFRGAHLSPFAGGSVTVGKSFSIN